MAFWGIEVKPGKPYTHSSKDGRGRLRISQATLATGSATIKSLVQCNVGDKSPVLLCALLPDKTESLQLDLEFDEAEDVIFSVIGPRGVYLTGYYVGHSRHSIMQDDTESYGEDIANSEESNHYSDDDEDEYEDSFINDDEPDPLTPSPVSSIRDDDDDDDDDDGEYLKKKKRDVKGGRKRLNKKCQIFESDDDDDEMEVIEIDDEKSSPISLATGKKNKKETKDELDKETKTAVDLKDEVNGHVVNGETEGKGDEPNEVPESKSKPKNKKRGASKEKKDTASISVNENNAINGDKNSNNVDDKSALEAVANEESLQVPINEVKTKKKKTKKGNAVKADDEDLLVVKDEEKLNDAGVGNSEDNVKPKKKRKTRGNSLEKQEDDQQPIDKCFDIDSNELDNGNHSEEKKAKKKKRRTNKTPDVDEKVEKEIKSEKMEECNKKILSNGLVIEDLVTGNTKGKIAAPGKKVKVQYVVKLKENGQVIDSNGESPYKFKLGDKQVIEGLNVGLDGMRVGDKRRLTIPPSMSLGYKGTGENVPPNSWLVYDVEMCSVH
ncbi:hypothetical protein L2E82_14710 [Cichorium intybus]|uniref:Uncharacterized protein n=1 Tax=Cichorium intybus TaxID=13427 RepID=A0ACB9F211_CICIN|nr:hypothetical protein L2E82_14710 [Cichorium intybus]